MRNFTWKEFWKFLTYSIGYFAFAIIFHIFVYTDWNYIVFMIILWPIAYEIVRKYGFLK